MRRHGQNEVSEGSLMSEIGSISNTSSSRSLKMKHYDLEKDYDLLLSRNAALEAEVKRLQQLVAELTNKYEVRKVHPLNDYLYSIVSRKASFREQILALVGTGRPIESMSQNVNCITAIKVRQSVYGSLTAVLTVIVRHTRRKHLAMIRHGRSPQGYRPSPERIEYFHSLHTIFGINESNRQQVRNFNQRLRAVITANNVHS